MTTGSVLFPAESNVSGVTINSACSGIHSFVIFVSCFYIAILYIGRLSTVGRIAVALLIGTIGTLAGNWLRIAIVLLTGYYTDFRTMMFVHDYAGLVVFLTQAYSQIPKSKIQDITDRPEACQVGRTIG